MYTSKSNTRFECAKAEAVTTALPNAVYLDAFPQKIAPHQLQVVKDMKPEEIYLLTNTEQHLHVDFPSLQIRKFSGVYNVAQFLEEYEVETLRKELDRVGPVKSLHGKLSIKHSSSGSRTDPNRRFSKFWPRQIESFSSRSFATVQICPSTLRRRAASAS